MSVTRQAGLRAGFTLIELLTVIGIITLLLGILIPVVSKVKMSSYVAATNNLIRVISGNIEAYYQNNQGYPGPIDDSKVMSGAATSVKLTPDPVKGYTSTTTPVLTSTQNCVLGLLGGLTPPTSNGGAVGYAESEVGKGAISLNFDNVGNPRQTPYGDIDSLNLPRKPWILPNNAISKTMNNTPYLMNGIPEFMDKFPDSKPILYVRAHSGNITGTASSGFNIAGYGVTYVYNAAALQPYGFPSNAPVVPTGGTALSLVSYFGNSNTANSSGVPTQARNQDTYILISAGPDGKYFTSDDMFN